MKKLRERAKAIYRKYTPSVKIPLIFMIMFLCMAPLIIQGRLLASSSRQDQVERRIIDVQNQCQIMAEKMSRLGYLSNSVVDNAGMDAELSTLGDIFNGRILIVNAGFRVIKDTFSLSEGKICIAEEIIRCFEGENTNRNNSLKHHFVLAIPIVESKVAAGPNGAAKTAGVMLVTASTESMLNLEERLMERASLYQVITFAGLIVLVSAVVYVIFHPFERLVRTVNRLADGSLDVDVEEETYLETRRISRAINRTLKNLKAVEQSRQEFVSNVSHELKTPITSIRVLADSLMSMENAPVELYQEFLRDISDEINRESDIIEDLLTLVRMDKAVPGKSIAPANINGLVKMILKRLRPIAKLRNIELIFESMRDVTADVDEVKLSLAVNNLVENAVKYNRENGWVRVTLDADHKFFYLKVADSGIGIPEELKERVFERFYRVDKARSRETGGTGLGLAITKSIVLMHHGGIRVESVLGEGTTFMVRIPLIYVS